MYKTRSTCRLCNGSFRDVVSLGDIYLSTFLDTNENQPPKIPIDLVVCNDCNLVQLRHTVDQDAMYREYWYQSGLNRSMRIALKDVVDQVMQRIDLNPGDIVVDIGSNDGTLLTNYNSDIIKVGFEPSNVANDLLAPNIIIHHYFNAKMYDHYFITRAKVITAIAMFYDLEDPHTFVADLAKVLDKDGILVIQMMDLMSMIEYNDFPNLCHEHLEYYSLSVLKAVLEAHGLEIFDVAYNGVNGGSLRAYVQHKGRAPICDSVSEALVDEERFFNGIGDLAVYFKGNIEDVREKVVDFIRSIDNVAVLGASTKGNTTLQYFGLTSNDITHAAEINPDKYGLHTVGSNIPIISQEESLALKPTYYLVLPWGFIDHFIVQLDDYLRNGGKFIVPLPHPVIISKDGDKLWRTYL